MYVLNMNNSVLIMLDNYILLSKNHEISLAAMFEDESSIFLKEKRSNVESM